MYSVAGFARYGKSSPVTMVRTSLLLVTLLLGSNGLFAQPAVYPMPDPGRTYANAGTGGNYMFNFYLPPQGTSTPWWPSWSPDGESLAFSMQGTIWQMRLDDGVAHEFVHRTEYLSSPEWSPDGKYVVFTADDGVRINLWLLEVATGETTALTSGDFLNLDPAWSPDGTRLAYVSTRPSGYFNVFVMDLESGEPGEILRVTEDHSFGRSRLYFGEYDLHIQPAWLSSADTLLVTSNRNTALGSGGVWRVPVESNGMTNARRVYLEETLYRTRADVSPDGTRFVYSSHLGGQFNNLFVLPVNGGEPYKLTFGEWDSFHPRWSPDGKTIAYMSNQGGLPQIRLLQTFGGRDKEVEIGERKWKTPVGKASVQVVDAATGEQLPARIYSTAEDGKVYVPDDAYHRQGRMAEHFFHTDGAFTLEVPVGKLVLEAMHGFEYYPTATTVSVEEGATVSVTLELRQMADLAAQGWYSGSNHVHMNYGGNLGNTPENLLYMAAAEDLHVVSNLVANKDNRILDYQYFTGAPHELSNDEHVLTFDQEYRPPFYGHVSFINLKEHLISPYTTGYEGTAIESLYPSNSQMFRLAREQGALGAYVHPYWGDGDPLDINLGVAKAFPVDLALGHLDYHELVSGAGWAAYRVWHHALNNGIRIPAVGGEDSISNLHRTAIIGQMRAYAYMEDGLSWDGWLNAIRSGNMFVTNGPLLELSVNGSGIGSTVPFPADGVATVVGRVQSLAPLTGAQLVVNGEDVDLGPLTADPDGMGTLFTFEHELKLYGSAWITLQAYSDGPVHPIDDRFQQATTNPIFVGSFDSEVRSPESAAYFIRWIDKLTEMAQAHPGWRSEEERTTVLGEFAEARQFYEKRLAEATQE